MDREHGGVQGETMDREHGGVQGYLSQRVKLTEAARQRLAMLYLEAPTR